MTNDVLKAIEALKNIDEQLMQTLGSLEQGLARERELLKKAEDLNMPLSKNVLLREVSMAVSRIENTKSHLQLVKDKIKIFESIEKQHEILRIDLQKAENEVKECKKVIQNGRSSCRSDGSDVNREGSTRLEKNDVVPEHHSDLESDILMKEKELKKIEKSMEKVELSINGLLKGVNLEQVTKILEGYSKILSDGIDYPDEGNNTASYNYGVRGHQHQKLKMLEILEETEIEIASGISSLREAKNNKDIEKIRECLENERKLKSRMEHAEEVLIQLQDRVFMSEEKNLEELFTDLSKL